MNTTTETRSLTTEFDTEQYRAKVQGLRNRLNRTLRGKQDVIERVLACILANGHILLEDLPGLGKTTLAKALASGLGGHFSRMQCTPDLMPSDVTGFSIFNQKTREFEFVEGPVFADILLADEINRTTPRTQSALFEAMAERQVTIDKHCHQLSRTFFVIATQNPIDSHGAYPLPEAQLDRFAMKLSVGYPGKEDEIDMLAGNIGRLQDESDDNSSDFSPRELENLQGHVAAVHVERNLLKYMVELAEFTRQQPEVSLGISPRGLLILQRVSQAWAFLQGRDFVIPDDVQAIAHPVLDVRISGDFDDTRPLIDQMLETIPVPVTSPS